MIVMKFGGTSVGTPERIHNAYEIVNSLADQEPVVVVSAVGGVTDLLLEAGKQALQGIVDIDAITQKHYRIIQELNLPSTIVEDSHEELRILLTGISMIREISSKTSDYLVSFGERISCRLVATYFQQQGLRSKHQYAYDIGMLTNANFQNAQPVPEAYKRIADALGNIDYIPVVTGFLGKNDKGEITTLGRGGSDYTAAILGAALNAKEIQIWTDVDGILSTDPRIVPTAHNIPQVSFKEAAELAYFGAKVLHPKTMRPAMDKNIPVVVKNTANPGHAGTRIIGETIEDKSIVKAISAKKKVSLINIYSLRMLDAFGFLARIFRIFEEHQVVVDMVSTSEVSVSITVDDGSMLTPVITKLSAFAQVKVEHDKAIVCIVGEGLNKNVNMPGLIFQTISEQGIKIHMISQGASDINLSFVVDQSDAIKAVESLHNKFFA